METWPSSLPVYPLVNGYSEVADRNVASFQPDIGPTIDRRRSSVASSVINFSLLLSVSEVSTLMTWYRDNLKDGVLPFINMHPRTQSSVIMRFNSAPQISAASYSLFNVSMSAVVLS